LYWTIIFIIMLHMNTLTLLDDTATASKRHPIQVVARRTGLSPDVIRAWERRYQAVAPQRSRTARRLYSDEDVARLSLLRQATESGRRIGDVARLSLAQLRALVQEDQGSAVPPTVLAGQPPSATAEYVNACLSAVQRLDPVALEAALAQAARSLSIPLLLREVIGTLMRAIGEHWREGLLRPCHEHMASVQIRFFLGNLLLHSAMTGTGPLLVVATPAGQRHELGALMVAVTAAQAGWTPLYLGADLPSDELAFAATARGAAAVALSLSYPGDDPHLGEALRRLRRQLPEGVVLLVGGAAAAGYQSVLTEIGALQPPDLATLRLELDRIRGGRD
jgi:DNA-binding transcriptional MerR regulator/methylmalonyl-CoA mutase cobalamin-binding subunit